MRYEGIRFSGLGPFRDPVEVDFSSIGGKLVAVTGANGAGKSTFCELLFASLTRKCPTRGTLASLATSRDAFLETRFVNGSAWTLRHSVDAVNGGGDSLVLDSKGAPAFDSAKRRAFDSWADKHLPNPDVLLASTFGIQSSQGFLDLSAAERKSVLLRLMGIDRLEALAEAARAHARDGKAEVAKQRALLESVGACDVEAAQAELVAAVEAVRLADEALVAAKARQERARAYGEVRDRIAPLRRQLEDLRERHANNAMILSEAEKIRAAVARRGELEVRIGELQESVAVAQATAAEAKALLGREQADLRALAEEGAGFEGRISAAQATLADRAQVEAAVAGLEPKRAAIREAEQAAEAQRAGIEELQVSMVGKAEGRIGALRTHLEGIVSTTKADSKPRAKAALLEDDATAKLIVDGPADLARRRAQVVEIERSLRALRNELAELERTAARADRLALAEEALEIALTDKEVHASLVDQRTAAVEQARLQSESAQKALTSAQARLQEVRDEFTRLAGLAHRAGPLEAAEARLAELGPQIERLAQELVGLEAVPVQEDGDFVGPAEAALASCRARRERAALQVETAKENATKREAYTAALAEAEADFADWVRLSEDLGKDGLQATLIDCAVPEVSEMCNDLLRNCFGPRFTVSIGASRLSADGKREVSGLEVTILDTVKGREGPAETFSGGERVILSESLSLALTMLACRQAGSRGATICRDESGAALDPINGRAWIAMLRRAAELIDCDKLLFVTHSAELADLADARLVVANGGVTVES